MRVVLGCVVLLPVVTLQVLLHLTPAAARYHLQSTQAASASHPSHIIQDLDNIQDHDDVLRRLDDIQQDPDDTWQYYEDIQQNNDALRQFLDDNPQDPDTVRNYLEYILQDPGVVQQYLNSIRQDANALQQYFDVVLQDPGFLQQYFRGIPDRVQKHIANVHTNLNSFRQYPWAGNQDAGTLQQYPQDTDARQYMKEYFLPQYLSHTFQNINSVNKKSGEAHYNDGNTLHNKAHQSSDNAYQSAGDAHRYTVNAQDKSNKGESEGKEVMMGYAGDSCRDNLSDDNTWCPSLLLQALGQHLSRLPTTGAPRQRPAHHVRRHPTTLRLPLSPQWYTRPPTKRYLGIELPDYIATTYSSIKTDNAHYLTKLHQLKQRMRSAGK
ncbi:uncharacterized protein LOC121874247 [Homarus americanus]|nr:uncharacterized protein LOC121874247 [Homarus americanus]